VTLDPATRRVTKDGVPVPLSAREFAVLEALLVKPGAVLSRAQLEDRLYGWGEEIESNAVSVYVHQLRRKLGADFIRNVRGVGYFVDPGFMTSIRARLLASLLGMLALAALLMGAVDLPQRPRRDRDDLRLPAAADGPVAARPGRDLGGAGRQHRRRAARLRDPDLDRRRPQHLRLAAACVAAGAGAARPGDAQVDGRAWRTYSVATASA
jgi:hypothetical protein